MALSYAVRSELVDHWIETQKQYKLKSPRRVYYLSMEYIFGKSLQQNIINLEINNPIESTIQSLGFSVDNLFKQEDDFELGNNGKGRSSACFLESSATLNLPVMGYGLRYDYAQYRQEIINGSQVEKPFDWLHRGHPWEIVRPEYSCTVQFGGSCHRKDEAQPLGPYEWNGEELVHAIPYDIPIAGYCNSTVNTLRLWSARADEEFLPDYSNHGDYVRAINDKNRSGQITQILFPEEDVRRAHDMRLRQQYFFVSAALQDIIRRYKIIDGDLRKLATKMAIQINGSRCALAIPELMRILIDQENMQWEEAWNITKKVFAYTSNSVNRDYLETWPVYKIAQILPRIMQIIFDINQVHLDEVRANRGDQSNLLRELSLIEEGEVKKVHFADLAVTGSFSTNGTSRVHTDILTRKIFPHFSDYFPERFSCKTNGIAHRRWLLNANKPLSNFIKRHIGKSWIYDSEKLSELEKLASDEKCIGELAQIKSSNKRKLTGSIKEKTGVILDDTMLFDVHVKSVHTGRRQDLHILHILHRYLRAKAGEEITTPRAYVFAGKASPSDFLAKQIIHLINITAELINNDPQVSDVMKVVFIPDFGMSWAEQIVPATDLSEQISSPEYEASGTFNMKFAFNGAITIASRSGSNIELLEKIGEDNLFVFGKSFEDIKNNHYNNPSDVLNSNNSLKEVFSFLEGHLPSVSGGHEIYPLISNICDSDRQYVIRDFDEYTETQRKIDLLYQNKTEWFRKSLLNIARVGWFSSDRLVREYARDVWKVSV
ncbi:Glycogen phosphorylase [Chitinispirillum alkaliphilum]|nr:Glycogen phosphorylase [Chitinispirillum alkaliphilum]